MSIHKTWCIVHVYIISKKRYGKIRKAWNNRGYFQMWTRKKTLLHVHADHSGNAVKNRLKSHLQESNVLKLLGRVRRCMTLVKCMRIHHEVIITSGYFLSRFLLNMFILGILCIPTFILKPLYFSVVFALYIKLMTYFKPFNTLIES